MVVGWNQNMHDISNNKDLKYNRKSLQFMSFMFIKTLMPFEEWNFQGTVWEYLEVVQVRPNG